MNETQRQYAKWLEDLNLSDTTYNRNKFISETIKSMIVFYGLYDTDIDYEKRILMNELTGVGYV